MKPKKYFHVSGRYVATLSMYGKEYEITLRSNPYAASVKGRIPRELVEYSTEWKEVIEIIVDDEIFTRNSVNAALAQAKDYFDIYGNDLLKMKCSALLTEFSKKVSQFLKPIQ